MSAEPIAALHESETVTSRDLRAASTLAHGAAQRARSHGTARLFDALADRLMDASEALAAHERGEAHPKCGACSGKLVAHIDSHPGYREGEAA